MALPRLLRVRVVRCPACNASVKIVRKTSSMQCKYCGVDIHLEWERPKPPPPPPSVQPSPPPTPAAPAHEYVAFAEDDFATNFFVYFILITGMLFVAGLIIFSGPSSRGARTGSGVASRGGRVPETQPAEESLSESETQWDDSEEILPIDAEPTGATGTGLELEEAQELAEPTKRPAGRPKRTSGQPSRAVSPEAAQAKIEAAVLNCLQSADRFRATVRAVSSARGTPRLTLPTLSGDKTTFERKPASKATVERCLDRASQKLRLGSNQTLVVTVTNRSAPDPSWPSGLSVGRKELKKRETTFARCAGKYFPLRKDEPRRTNYRVGIRGTLTVDGKTGELKALTASCRSSGTSSQPCAMGTKETESCMRRTFENIAFPRFQKREDSEEVYFNLKKDFVLRVSAGPQSDSSGPLAGRSWLPRAATRDASEALSPSGVPEKFQGVAE